MSRVLGISASLRNARLGRSSNQLVTDIKGCRDEDELRAYIDKHVRIRVDEFIAAGRNTGKSFDQMFKQLRRGSSDQGLSNSEAAVAVSLWAAHQKGSDIAYLSLAEFFSPNGGLIKEHKLKQELLAADALILSGPVYFGDRGSLAQSFLEYIQSSPEIMHSLRNRLYAGVAVGAKRNGGQETTLIYQLLDFLNTNMLAVGNSASTTSQYGGTIVAGDIGTFTQDGYGFSTALGTGERVAEVSQMQASGKEVKIDGKINVHLWLLQDSEDGTGHEIFKSYVNQVNSKRSDVNFTIWTLTQEEVARCIACDICPIRVGPREEYRCIITSKRDFFAKNHEAMLQADAILMCAYSPTDRTRIISNYQQFIERTRYIRRDNYLFSNTLFAPFVISELNARQNLHLRMLTSAIRHHSVLHHPLIDMRHKGESLNGAVLMEQIDSFLDNAKQLIAGQLLKQEESDPLYRPMGYTISKEQVASELASGNMKASLETAKQSRLKERSTRLRIGNR